MKSFTLMKREKKKSNVTNHTRMDVGPELNKIPYCIHLPMGVVVNK